ncbi:putative MscS family protein YkuT [bacterium HR33]|nr:putative MscS family protein YkuT [bacterium HR33]
MPVLVQLRETLDRILEALSIDLNVAVVRAVQVAGIVALSYLGYRLLKLLTRRIEKAVEDDDPTTLSEREQRAKTLAQLLNSVGAVAISIAAGLTILNLFIAIGPLLAGVGVVGLAISFGAQSLVKDVINGFFILLENQFGVGDVVEINGVAGAVEKMTMRVVMLRDLKGVLHVIPNGSINMVSNRTRGWSRTVLDVGVAYKEDVDHVIGVMRDVAREFWSDPQWKSQLVEEPAVWGVEALADSSVNIRLVATTRPGAQWNVGRELRRRIKKRFDAEGIEIPFPQRTLHLGDSEALIQLLSRREAESGTAPA